MISRILISTLLALPLCATRPTAVRIVLQADATTEGVNSPDPAKLSAAFNAFVKHESLAEPTGGGDGWVLGVRIMPVKTIEGLVAAKAIFRLSHLDGGKISDSGAKESMSLITAADDAKWDATVVREAWSLLNDAKVVTDLPVLSQRQWAKQSQTSKDARVAFDFAEVRTLRQPPMPKMTDTLPARGGVVANILDIDMDAQGRPEAVLGREGTDATLARMGAWLLSWTFEPAKVKGAPVPARFSMRMMLDFKKQR